MFLSHKRHDEKRCREGVSHACILLLDLAMYITFAVWTVTVIIAHLFAGQRYFVWREIASSPNHRKEISPKTERVISLYDVFPRAGACNTLKNQENSLNLETK